MAAKHLKPPDPDLELNRILTSFKEDLHHSIGNGDSVEMMLNGGGGSFGGGGASMRESYSYTGGGEEGGGGGRGTPFMMRSKFRRWTDSFRRDPKGRMTPKNAFVGTQQGRNYFDLRAANYRTANPLLAKELKGRHLQMIAIGGSIGKLDGGAWPLDGNFVCVCVLSSVWVFFCRWGSVNPMVGPLRSYSIV